MNNDTPADAITQADIDLANAIISGKFGNHTHASRLHASANAIARHRTTSLAAQDVADAVDEAETSLLVWTDAAWNGQIPGDARDFCRAQYGRFKQLRETLGLPEYKRPEFQERDLSIVQASLAAQDGLVGALRILAEEIAGIEQGDQEDLKLYLALLYHLQDRIAALASIEVKSHE